jgi:hypothetical protein
LFRLHFGVELGLVDVIGYQRPHKEVPGDDQAERDENPLERFQKKPTRAAVHGFILPGAGTTTDGTVVEESQKYATTHGMVVEES